MTIGRTDASGSAGLFSPAAPARVASALSPWGMETCQGLVVPAVATVAPTSGPWPSIRPPPSSGRRCRRWKRRNWPHRKLSASVGGKQICAGHGHFLRRFVARSASFVRSSLNSYPAASSPMMTRSAAGSKIWTWSKESNLTNVNDIADLVQILRTLAQTQAQPGNHLPRPLLKSPYIPLSGGVEERWRNGAPTADLTMN